MLSLEHNSFFLLSTGKDEYCNMDTFNATCPRDHVILMKTARYGRMQIGRCVKRNLGYVGCSVDVLVYMDRVCSGKRHCEVSIPNPTLFATQPCPEDTTPYLEATFDCIPGARVTFIHHTPTLGRLSIKRLFITKKSKIVSHVAKSWIHQRVLMHVRR